MSLKRKDTIKGKNTPTGCIPDPAIENQENRATHTPIPPAAITKVDLKRVMTERLTTLHQQEALSDRI